MNFFQRRIMSESRTVKTFHMDVFFQSPPKARREGSKYTYRVFCSYPVCPHRCLSFSEFRYVHFIVQSMGGQTVLGISPPSPPFFPFAICLCI